MSRDRDGGGPEWIRYAEELQRDEITPMRGAGVIVAVLVSLGVMAALMALLMFSVWMLR